MFALAALYLGWNEIPNSILYVGCSHWPQYPTLSSWPAWSLSHAFIEKSSTREMEKGNMQNLGLPLLFSFVQFHSSHSICCDTPDVHAQLLWSCITLCNPMDCTPPGFSVDGILQARIPEWVACPPPGDHPDLEIDPTCLAFQVDSSPLSHQGRYSTPDIYSLISKVKSTNSKF